MLLLIRGFNFQSRYIEALNFSCITASYVVLYLGLNRLLLRLLSRSTHTGPVIGFLMCLVLVGFGALIPMTVQFSMARYLPDAGDYTLIQLPNLFWTTAEVVDGNNYSVIGRLFHPLMILIACGSGFVFFLNLIFLPSDVHAQRIATPARVLEEEAELNPAPVAEAQRQSPWDD